MKISMMLISIVVIVMIIGTVSAHPEILDGFNTKYNTFGTKLDTCDTCHIPKKPQKPVCEEVCHVPNKPSKEVSNLNPYGVSIKNNLNIEISQALSKIENLDSDGDKFADIDEIHNLTFPGNKNDKQEKNNKSILSKVDNILGILKI